MNNQNFQVDFIGIGAPKTGTTWLAKCLAQHPQICFSRVKEVNFFNQENFFFIKSQVLNEGSNYERGLDWYKKHFEHYQPGQIKGEFSVIYLYDKETPRRIHENFPTAKIIAIIRNPIELFYTHYYHVKSQWKLPPLETFVNEKSDFLKYGFFADCLERYAKYFPPEQMLVLFHDDLKKDPAAAVKNVYNFLEVDENFVPRSLHEKVNVTAPKTVLEVKLFFSLRNWLIKTVGKKIVAYPRLLKTGLKIDQFIRQTLKKTSNRRKSFKTMPAVLQQKLIDLYLPEIERLEKIFNRDLGAWKKIPPGTQYID